jgi:hypothetical protein
MAGAQVKAYVKAHVEAHLSAQVSPCAARRMESVFTKSPEVIGTCDHYSDRKRAPALSSDRGGAARMMAIVVRRRVMP